MKSVSEWRKKRAIISPTSPLYLNRINISLYELKWEEKVVELVLYRGACSGFEGSRALKKQLEVNDCKDLISVKTQSRIAKRKMKYFVEYQ